MSWTFDPNPSGLFTLVNPVGRPILDIAFRHDIPEEAREKVLERIRAALTEMPKP
jgi:hypothetical protein